ncbi:MAG TPA: hypothetical protein DCW46_01235 [Desulfotomaculum sp.]|nr:hypothetical protein [Desulfotomaculum sp.]
MDYFPGISFKNLNPYPHNDILLLEYLLQKYVLLPFGKPPPGASLFSVCSRFFARVLENSFICYNLPIFAGTGKIKNAVPVFSSLANTLN